MKKAIIEEFIYRLIKDKEKNVILKDKVLQWSTPVIGFSYNKSLPEKFVKNLSGQSFFKEPIENIICIMGDWESVAEGIILTNESIYVIPTPITPDTPPIIKASALNNLETSFLRPPRERITPISLTLSITDT